MNTVLERLTNPGPFSHGTYASGDFELTWGAEGNRVRVGSNQLELDDSQILQVSTSTTQVRPWWAWRSSPVHWLHVELRGAHGAASRPVVLSSRIEDVERLAGLPKRDCEGRELPVEVLLEAAEAWLASGVQLAHLPSASAPSSPAPIEVPQAPTGPNLIGAVLPSKPKRKPLPAAPLATFSKTLHPVFIVLVLVFLVVACVATLFALINMETNGLRGFLLPATILVAGSPLFLLQARISRAQLSQRELGVPLGCGRRQTNEGVVLTYTVAEPTFKMWSGFAVLLGGAVVGATPLEWFWSLIVALVVCGLWLHTVLRFSVNELHLGVERVVWRRKVFGLSSRFRSLPRTEGARCEPPRVLALAIDRSWRRAAIAAVAVKITIYPYNDWADVTLSGPNVQLMSQYERETGLWLGDEISKGLGVPANVEHYQPPRRRGVR